MSQSPGILHTLEVRTSQWKGKSRVLDMLRMQHAPEVFLPQDSV